jgi:propionyl-CoA carboxylase alpha chain
MPAIRRVLVANRGEIVSRVARTARRLGVRTVGVYAEDDGGQPYVHDVDLAVAIQTAKAPSPYLDVDVMLRAAEVSRADAVHPGYGFLAENAEFARAVTDAGLTWIGPPATAIAAMGGKVRAKQLAAEAGVAVLDSVEVGEDFGAALPEIDKLGYPLLVKPSAGGGGKGMYRVDDSAQLREMLASARRAATAAFADGALFVERYIEAARHVELQVMADQRGHVIHLGTRDCSVQRRHQKIIEEAPAPSLDPQLIERMASASLRLVSSIGYVGAGTLEFLVFGDEYAFLEMNTRLQVEHGVTEEVTGLDLVELQFRAASGAALGIAQDDVRLGGHAIEARVYAEIPARDFLPSTGQVTHLSAAARDGVRYEWTVAAGSQVGTRYDPMIGKVIAVGRDRDEAIGRLISALLATQLHGLSTNRDLLVSVLDDADFRACELSTDFLTDHPQLLTAQPEGTPGTFLAIAAAVWVVSAAKRATEVFGFAPIGWRQLRTADPVLELTDPAGGRVPVGYRVERDGSWTVTVAGQAVSVLVHQVTDEVVDLAVDRVRRRCAVTRSGPAVYASCAEGSAVFTVADEDGAAADAGPEISERASVPGVVSSIAVADGDIVKRGDLLLTLEAMKMEHRITAERDATVARIAVVLGQSVEYGQMLVELADSDGDSRPRQAT